MKKIIIGALVGGILIFLWQTASWTFLSLHRNAQQYTEKQDTIMSFLNSQFSENGQYFMPSLPPDASMKEHEALMESAKGKPWASVSYHKAMKVDMGMNMIKGLLVNIVMVGLFCWILSRMAAPKFGTVLTAGLFVGLIVFLNVPYTVHIWYETFDLMAGFLDAVVGWGLCSLWLGWWYTRK